MQRRRNPHISSPGSPAQPNYSHQQLPDDPQVTNTRPHPRRIYIVVILLVAIILLVHRLLPSRALTPLPSYASDDLKPKNYFNASAPLANPLPFCHPGGPLAAKYGTALPLTRQNSGTGYRIQRVLNRALAGQPVTISIIGGSISACHGAGDDPVSPKCYPSKFFDWWNTVFPHPATELTNGAMRRTTSDYFGFCSGHHVPDVTDLVIVELDSDDVPGQDKLQTFEFLIRSLLTRPDQPAVLILGHFSPQVFEAFQYTGPDHWHGIVAQVYDVPYISTKALLFNDYIEKHAKINKYYVDPILANPEGHTLLADVLVAYMQYMTCQTWETATSTELDPTQLGKSKDSPGLFGGIGLRKGVPEPGSEANGGVDADGERSKQDSPRKSSDPRLKVPSGLMSDSQGSNQQFEEIAPYCVSANDLINPLPPSLFYGSGWSAYHPPPSSSSSHGNQDGPGGATAAHYFYSTIPLSRIRIPIVVGHGDVGVYYLQEGEDRLTDGGSQIECWVDDNYQGRKILSNELEKGNGVRATLTLIDHRVSRGSHFVECELAGDPEKGAPMFKIVGIFAN